MVLKSFSDSFHFTLAKSKNILYLLDFCSRTQTDIFYVPSPPPRIFKFSFFISCLTCYYGGICDVRYEEQVYFLYNS